MSAQLKNPRIIFFALLLLCILAFPILLFRSSSIHSEPADENQICGIESCHGLDISCGENVPEACTRLYRIGDFCRQYARCEIINGQCQLIKDSQFEDCKSSVERCLQIKDHGEQLDCEARCRQQINP